MTDPQKYAFQNKEVSILTELSLDTLAEKFLPAKTVIITDYHIYRHHHQRIHSFPVIKIPPGEEHKIQQTVDYILDELIRLEAGKDVLIIGLGGGVVTDLAGYVASVYKRGTRLALMPTSVLAMVDAAIGGKNGVNKGIFKNMIGTVSQPDYIIYDYSLLGTLPAEEWINGMAEVIKHAVISDPLLFRMLEEYTMHDIQSDLTLAASIIEKNIQIKMEIVTADESENSIRKWLNFGHTIGHALENLHQIPHGHAVSIGMVAAANLAVRLNRFHFEEAARLIRLLAKYHLPVDIETDYTKVMEAIRQDKKRAGQQIQMILPDKIGAVSIVPLSLDELSSQIKHIL